MLPQQASKHRKMFTSGTSSSASHDAERQAELAAREAAREVVRNSSSPTLEELCRSISPFSPECFGEDVEASSPPSSGRASVDSVAIYNATVRAELHATQSLQRIQQLEGELSVARRQVDALQWSRGLHTNELKETQALCKQHERGSAGSARGAAQGPRSAQGQGPRPAPGGGGRAAPPLPPEGERGGDLH
ncbi:unnamed protein product [Cylicocyclus nassatus]|uniref:Uncharacterized protein n=1 Tax=Cylicocyclus nassatus TaxID=53992 RepID=A0AA36M8P0_CYLNA|nr:unnamed protein product [Cylicocyclus nassatus]